MADTQARPAAPARRHYKPELHPAPFSALPFTHQPRRGPRRICYWRIQPVSDYWRACALGREYAAHYAQFLKDNPSWAGMGALGHIAADIDFTDETVAKGCWVGFFAHLERLILTSAQLIDVYADLDRVQAHYAAIQARSTSETQPATSKE